MSVSPHTVLLCAVWFLTFINIFYLPFAHAISWEYFLTPVSQSYLLDVFLLAFYDHVIKDSKQYTEHICGIALNLGTDFWESLQL